MTIGLLLCLLTPISAAADSDPLTVVVTGTRTERSDIDAPVRTEVVSQRELQRTHARTLKEALENIPGLQLREIHGKSGYEASLQGLSGEQVLVLIDGLPVSASTGSTIDLSQLALADIERIEVVKGAMSAQYGSAAMGGVINVITRQLKPGLSGEIQLDGGSYGDQNPSGKSSEISNRHARLRVASGSQQWRLQLAADKRDSEGIDPDPASWAQPGNAIDRQQLNLRGEWLVSPMLRLHLAASEFEEYGRSRYDLILPGNTAQQSKTEQIERRRFSGGGEWLLRNGLRMRLNMVDEQYDDSTLKFSGKRAFDDRRAELGLTHITGIVDLPAWHGHLLQLGVEYHADSLGQTKDGNSELDSNRRVTRDSREVFVQDDWLLSDLWELVLGIRYQNDSDFGSHTSPKANLRGHLLRGEDWNGTLRIGWGSGYRVPNLKERHYRFDHSQLGYVVIGNPELQPETSSSWQLGWRMSWRNRHWLDINLFDNRLQNLIQVDESNAPVVNGITQFSYQNLSRARTRGIELSAHWQPSYALGLKAGVTRMRTRDESTGRDLTRRPDTQINLGMDWQLLDKLGLTTRTRYQSSELVSSTGGERSPAWSVLDLTLNYDLSNALRLFMGIDNLFHEQRDFTDASDFGPVAGRFTYAGLRYAWGNP